MAPGQGPRKKQQCEYCRRLRRNLGHPDWKAHIDKCRMAYKIASTTPSVKGFLVPLSSPPALQSADVDPDRQGEEDARCPAAGGGECQSESVQCSLYLHKHTFSFCLPLPLALGKRLNARGSEVKSNKITDVPRARPVCRFVSGRM